MKQKALSAIIVVLFFSCHKKDDSSPVPQTKFKFTANSYSNEWDASLVVLPRYGAVIRKEITAGVSGYGLSATDSSLPAQNSHLYLMVQTNSPLALTTYTSTTSSTTHNFPDEGSQINSSLGHYWPSQNGDFTSITITNIHNGYADGTFTAKMTQLTSGAPITVNVSGSFSSVKILE